MGSRVLFGAMKKSRNRYYSVQFSSVAQSCLTLCDPMNRSTPGFPVHHHLPEFTQTHIHRFRDAIQPSYPSKRESSLSLIYILLEVSTCICMHMCVLSCSVMSDSLRPHESQHPRPPCPSPSPRVHSDSHPSSR